MRTDWKGAGSGLSGFGRRIERSCHSTVELATAASDPEPDVQISPRELQLMTKAANDALQSEPSRASRTIVTPIQVGLKCGCWDVSRVALDWSQWRLELTAR